MKRPLSLLAALLALAGCQSSPQSDATVDATHRKLLTLDTHLDTPVYFGRQGWNFGDRHDMVTDIAQLDLPRMEDGNLDGGFFAIFTPQGPLTPAGYADALRWAQARSTQIDQTMTRYASRIGAARSADDAEALTRQGKLVAYKSIENSYPLGESIKLLADFQRQGVRLVGVVHTQNNQFADSATDKPRWNGLSPLGREWVAEMNRLGMVIDASHASDAVFDQLLEQSTTPILLSHSGSRAMFDHPRNLDDGRLRKLAAAGGAMCFTTIYLGPVQMGEERSALFDKVEHISELTPAEQADLIARWHALDATTPLWTSNFEQYMAALLHVIKVAGVEHVCFGADFDGGGGITGLDHIGALPRITGRLKAAGYSDDDLQKMWSGNVLRILREAERRRASKGDT
ncbi:membrane dipeptidase [Pseudoduganella sp. FT26W]|uniref:Type IV secretion system putative lipoprotein virB7 n=1 Tax=Duganella aquatilis TaxID=2666082 RepID=A0A844D301_9BURK|nr:membrane dipeptidase [Duganella aquatilis]MRW83052.1 membrane dipeptidase [Duganella aquatilis]